MTATTSVYRVSIPDGVAEIYEKQAAAAGVAPEDLLAQRLEHSVHHTAQKPLYLSDEQRGDIDNLIGRNIQRPKELVEAIRHLAQIRVENSRIQLSPEVIRRLRARNLSGQPFEHWLAAQVLEWAERYVEMR